VVNANVFFPAPAQDEKVEIDVLGIDQQKANKIEESQAVIVLINRWSKLLINEKPSTLKQAEELILKNYRIRFNEFYGTDLQDFPEEIKDLNFYVQKDQNTDPANFENLLNIIGNCMLTFRNEFARSLYDADYNSLKPDQKQNIIKLVPAKVYQILPDKKM
jgi:hypothetical protein